MQKHVLITGCSSGIGLKAATTLNSRGYRVFATARNAECIKKLESSGITPLQLDLASSDSIETAIHQLLAITNGQLDGLFNNAGFGIPGAVEDLSRTALRTQLETNLVGPFELINRIIPVMRNQGHGRIIQNSSVLGLVAFPFRGAYCASKFAMEALSDTLRMELTGTNIHISLIEPGPIVSNFRRNAYNAFQTYINPEQSIFKDQYQNMVSRLTREGTVAPFTLPASAVVDKLIHALESPRPKARYYVTLPTYLFAYLKRILPATMLDRILLMVSKRETTDKKKP